MYTCYLFGHHNTPDSLQEVLDHEIEHHINHLGVRRFVVGCSGNFDRIACNALQEAKRRHPELYAFLLVPQLSDTVNIPIPEGFDDIYYPTGLLGLPRRFAIPKASRLLVREASYIITYVHPQERDLDKLLHYADCKLKKGDLLQILNLSDKLK